MKILRKDYRKGVLRLKIETLDDLWFLHYVIEANDYVTTKTFRKIKVNTENKRNKNISKKTVVLTIKIEKVFFSKYTDVLRVSGTVVEGKEDIPAGSYHTFSLEIGTELKLEKKIFLKYHIDKINEAVQNDNEKILIVIHDREEAIFAELKKYGYEILCTIKGQVRKKLEKNQEKGNFFELIKKTILDYEKTNNFTRIVIASPSFWKEYMQKIMDENISSKITYGTVSSISINGINEAMKRPELQHALKKQRFFNETQIVDRLLKEILQGNKAEYGIDALASHAGTGAVSEIFITNEFIQKTRKNEEFEKMENLIKQIESMNGKTHLISSDHEGGKKLDGLGGIGLILRYKKS